MDPFYINGYIKFVWIIISSTQTPASRTTSPQRQRQINHKLFTHFNNKYGKFIQELISNSQIASINLVISIYYLYQHYHHNSILRHKVQNENALEKEETSANVEEFTDSMVIYMIIASLILSNKSFDDQSYTLKTWWIIIDNTNRSQPTVNIDIKLLNTIEAYFLASLDYKLSFIEMSSDDQFWKLIEDGGCINNNNNNNNSSSNRNSKLFKFNKSILLRFKSLITLTEESQMTNKTNVALNWNGCPPILPSTPPPLLYSSSSPFTSTTFSSPLNYPLTPSTPMNSNNTANTAEYSCIKRRKIHSNPILMVSPSQSFTTTPTTSRQLSTVTNGYYQTTISQQYQTQQVYYPQPSLQAPQYKYYTQQPQPQPQPHPQQQQQQQQQLLPLPPPPCAPPKQQLVSQLPPLTQNQFHFTTKYNTHYQPQPLPLPLPITQELQSINPYVTQMEQSKYKCPKCKLPYCSLACYKSHSDKHNEEIANDNSGSGASSSNKNNNKNISLIDKQDFPSTGSKFDKFLEDEKIRYLLKQPVLQFQLLSIITILQEGFIKNLNREQKLEVMNLKLSDLRIGGIEENELVEEFVERVLQLNETL
ncbi:hypothetical protein KGF56_004429 [Candida oxycetoniae]|uniref:HIT-type domain-containing protein n=1 Tax=Candida oxycetoniae TaxID=497107 RepID=A0AAI9WW18_9ASCO|nr:uncharacterized protein KGF56_004429 [Candida oxycetoniae]KAI3402755.2 hypothetical protein KGF56_004429 [Candida oxycetoniae]